MRIPPSLFTLLVLLGVTPIYSQNCNLVVPANPLTAVGLATPYISSSTTVAIGAATPTPNMLCSQLNFAGSVYVEAVILDLATGAFKIYFPLVVDATGPASIPAVAPVVPVLPTNNIVGIWFGGNNMITTLVADTATGLSLTQGNCVNGPIIDGVVSQFGEYAYCNAIAFYAAANNLIIAGLIVIPPLGRTVKGQPCPTVRSWWIVDQDQSDNVGTTYIITATSQVAQPTLANLQALTILQQMNNASDNRLMATNTAPPVGCTPFLAPDAIDPSVMRPSQGLNELQAAAYGGLDTPLLGPALVPSGDPMALAAGVPNLAKLNAYRAGVNQPLLTSLNPADTTQYCLNMYAVAGPTLALHASELNAAASLVPTVGNTQLNLLVAGFGGSWMNLNCQALTGLPVPFTPILNGQGTAVGNNLNVVYPIEFQRGLALTAALTATVPIAAASIFTVTTLLFINGGLVLLTLLVAVVCIVRRRRNQVSSPSKNGSKSAV